MSDSDDTSDFNEEAENELVRDFENEGQLILNNLLPKKSYERYEIVYNGFIEWCKNNNTNSFEENILLVYFNEISKKIKPSTIWARWSMLRTTLILRHNIDISTYVKLKSFLKNFSKGYKPKQAKTLTGEEVQKFLESADDLNYLAIKVILIFGICGATRCCELVNLKISDIEDLGNYFNVNIRDSKNDYPRTFVICAPHYETVKKYLLLRPTEMNTERFFIYYTKGKCYRQVIGKHKIAEAIKTIASFLNLQDVDAYTGHTLRRTSATLLSDSGASLVRIKNLGAWKSDSVAQRYIDNSKITKKQNFDGIMSSVSSCNPSSASTSTSRDLCNFVCAESSSDTINELSVTDNPLQNIVNLGNVESTNVKQNVFSENSSNKEDVNLENVGSTTVRQNVFSENSSNIEDTENINSSRSGKKEN